MLLMRLLIISDEIHYCFLVFDLLTARSGNKNVEVFRYLLFICGMAWRNKYFSDLNVAFGVFSCTLDDWTAET
jgi:hypothetical protein